MTDTIPGTPLPTWSDREAMDRIVHCRYYSNLEDAIAGAEQLRAELFHDFAGRG